MPEKTDEQLEAEAIRDENDKPKFDPTKRRSIFEIIKDLSDENKTGQYVKTRKQGGTDIKYIPHYNVTKLLDYYANGWTYSIKSVQHIADKVVMVVAIGIPCLEASDGFIWREASGCEDDDKNSFGDSFSSAESMALRRAASKFGCGRGLYSN